MVSEIWSRTHKLLETLKTNSSQSPLADRAFEALDVGCLAERKLILVVALDFLVLFD